VSQLFSKKKNPRQKKIPQGVERDFKFQVSIRINNLKWLG
jgi:hypothetical protein